MWSCAAKQGNPISAKVKPNTQPPQHPQPRAGAERDLKPLVREHAKAALITNYLGSVVS